MAPGESDSYDLTRFVTAQEGVYADVLGELRIGKKRTHWMWFVFPQIDGLGRSVTTKHYAIKSLAEARAYLEHPVLGPRLVECTEAVMGVHGRSVSEIFGAPDDLKFHSSMTLFEHVADRGSVFSRAIGRLFAGNRDAATLRMIDGLQRD